MCARVMLPPVSNEWSRNPRRACPWLVSQRVRAVDPAQHPRALSELASLASTPNGWFSLDGQRLSPQVPALIEKFANSGLIERRRDPSGEGDALHFVDEGLPSYLWMLSARAAPPAVATAAA